MNARSGSVKSLQKGSRDRRRDHSSSLSRGLEILRLVQQGERMRAAEIGSRLDIPTSTLYRYLRQLMDANFLVEVDGYVLASDRFTDPSAEYGSTNLARCAAPVLSRLRQLTGHTGVLTVRVRTAALCLDVALAHTRYRKLSLHPGKVSVLYAGASVTPLLAFAPVAVIEEVLRGPLRRYTRATPDRDGLLAELEMIREAGYAISRGALDPGMTGVGIPVLSEERCLCALSLVGPSADLAIPDRAVQALRHAADVLLQSVSKEAVAHWNAGDDEG